MIFGRYRRTDDGALVIRGRRNGRAERYATDVTLPDHHEGNDYMPRLWAARKLGVLQQAVRLNGPNPELIAEIRATALRYGLLSEYTSYLVQEPDAVAMERRVPRARPANEPMALAAPGRVSGAGAVASARADQARREVRTAADLSEVDEAIMNRGHMRQAIHVAGRLFELRDSVWTDTQHADSSSVVQVAPYSPAYFELLRILPELEPILARFERVVVAGDRIAIEISPGGVTSAGRIVRLVAGFRGA